ncbi:circularly permuted type 2 ATP-grasp protein [Geoalkalibacter halelectricus]|uniref:Circularly permuted type 2 ATP-grasp protein n=1 Tax=Geoalkalibacter halelectricus TaxID=2847045 RepID=A0ABY5ZQW8_9BACT|nr:circularly permuted type 2 ATP-grasp protein [Geoalkalibacter halelectricus]MDO3379250.1 circularly permuted type 2 ATP-grasp protein [Geoalkalibacter halelectricus]UWZ81008.1 circularly permuted type 2 ATP-grasp protein [Geoalkalibacter halelectricus]
MPQPAKPQPGSISQAYATKLQAYDEMFAGEGQLLPHWQPLTQELDQLGREGLRRRQQMALRLLRENGVTFNVHNGLRGAARPWQLDPIPLFISADEWVAIEAGLIQRAELLNLILADLYGPQRLLKDGIVPPELIFAHAGFQRAVVGMNFPDDRPLVLCSSNLARGPDGRMWVIDDRTQAPSGAGYALENRMVMTRIAPALFRKCHVKRLAAFFQPLRDRLARLAPQNREDPRIVVLTPGPYSSTYFEHAYLANYLGYTLVQGDDLSVRDGRVWLKTLEGLRQVDVILRRLNDDYCDPLELREDSQLGVTGLLQAARLGHVAIANPIGSGALENPGLAAFLPGIARYLLGEDLKLPSVATWWCGQERERDFVLANLNRLVIKPIHRTRGYRALFGAQLSAAEQAAVRERILRKPHLYIGQEMVSFSTAPSLVDGAVEPRNAVLRSFLVAGDQGYNAMPGGLTRISPLAGDLVVSNKAGGLSKDAWVLSKEPVHYVSLWRKPKLDQVLPFHSEPLPSRAADSLFWAGRYVERSEGMARLLRSIFLLRREMRDANGEIPKPYLHSLLRALTHVTGTYPGFVGEGCEKRLQKPLPELRSLLFDSGRTGSLTATLEAFGQATLSVRDYWPTEVWRVVDAMRQDWGNEEDVSEPRSYRVEDRLNHLIMQLVAFSGLGAESMPREAGWMLLDTGRRLERALGLISLVRATLVPRMEEGVQRQLMETVLVTCDSLNAFRRRYRSYMHLPTVLELILMDPHHPRSLAFQLDCLQQHIAELPRAQPSQRLGAEERCILEAYTRVRLADAAELAKVEEDAGIAPALDDLLAAQTESLWCLSDLITSAYFSHSLPAQQLSPQRTVEEL